jgi:hypothetical protein
MVREWLRRKICAHPSAVNEYAVVDSLEAQAMVDQSTTTSTPPPRLSAQAGIRQRANGGLGEYYSEHETRTPVWLLAGDTRKVATLTGLTDEQRSGGEAGSAVVAR